MKNGNFELGDAHMVEESAKRLLHRMTNETSQTDRSSPSIFMVPSVLRDLSPSSFNPRLVSIGPLHREDTNAQAFEGQKSSYVIKLISRISKYPQEEIIKSCMQKAYTSMNRIKACYVWTKTYDDAEIAEMMVMDACFILGYLVEVDTQASSESHLGTPLQYLTISCDLLLLENQIPLFFLYEIFQCTILKFAPSISLVNLIRPVISWHSPFKAYLNLEDAYMSTNHHIVSLLHQSFEPPYNVTEDIMYSKIHSAIDLNRAGVSFKPNKDQTWVLAMQVKRHRFWFFFGSWSKPTLTMSRLQVHDNTEFILRNLIAYEHSFRTQRYVSSYVTAIDMLVNTQEDIAKLVESGVINNIMGSNKEAANMINNLGKNVAGTSFYGAEWEKLNKYCDGYWPKHITRMKSTYFSSPWSIIALVAGIILFVLQVVQTIFTVKSFENK